MQQIASKYSFVSFFAGFYTEAASARCVGSCLISRDSVVRECAAADALDCELELISTPAAAVVRLQCESLEARSQWLINIQSAIDDVNAVMIAGRRPTPPLDMFGSVPFGSEDLDGGTVDIFGTIPFNPELPGNDVTPSDQQCEGAHVIQSAADSALTTTSSVRADVKAAIDVDLCGDKPVVSSTAGEDPFADATTGLNINDPFGDTPFIPGLEANLAVTADHSQADNFDF